jgi:hypothetical protein
MHTHQTFFSDEYYVKTLAPINLHKSSIKMPEVIKISKSFSDAINQAFPSV